MAALIAPGIPQETCDVAFKEWAGVCDALASGRQSLILRKGGVAEGPDGFRPDHPAFWLYSTHVHEAEQGLRTPGPAVEEVPGIVELSALAVVEWTGRVERVEQLPRLAGMHDWTETTVLQRFHYRSPGLWALSVRVYRGPEPDRITVTPAQLGCKTWVILDRGLPTAGLHAVLDVEESARRLGRLRATLGVT